MEQGVKFHTIRARRREVRYMRFRNAEYREAVLDRLASMAYAAGGLVAMHRALDNATQRIWSELTVGTY